MNNEQLLVELVGSKCVSTFVDRAGRVVLTFEREQVSGTGATRKLTTKKTEVRIRPDEVVSFGRKR